MVATESAMPNLIHVALSVFAFSIFALFESPTAFGQAQADYEVVNTSPKNGGNLEIKKEGESVPY